MVVHMLIGVLQKRFGADPKLFLAKDFWQRIDRHLLVHLALLTGQLMFGGGAIVAKLALHGKNPLIFAFVREFAAGLLFCVRPGCTFRAVWHDHRLFFLAGFSMYVNHMCFIVGLSLADPISGTAWQPSQPILTFILASLLGLERVSLIKTLGIFISVVGALVMVLCAPGASQMMGASSTSDYFHHIFFFLNCLAASCYVLVTKELLKRHAPDAVTGWCYLVGSTFMLVSALYARTSEDWLLPGLSNAEPGSDRFKAFVEQYWTIPDLWAVIYMIVASSLLGYWLIAWANQFAQASVVSAYTAAQPMATCLISIVMILVAGVQWTTQRGIRPPGVQDFGILLILLGLGILTREPQAPPKQDVAKLPPSSMEMVATSCEATHRTANCRLVSVDGL